MICALLLLLILGITHNNSIINHHECLIGNEKKINGVLFRYCLDYWHFTS